MNSKNSAIGVFIRRLIAIKADARKIAESSYNALTKGMDYVEQGADRYMEQVRVNEIKLINKLAKKHSIAISYTQNTA